jgi:selenocysteine-specific elongation factor
MIAGEGLTELLAEARYGIKQSTLMHLTGQAAEQISLPAGAVVIEAAREGYVLSLAAWRALGESTTTALRKFHEEFPDEAGPDVGRLRRIALPQLPDELWRALVAELANNRVLLRSGPALHMPGHVVTLSGVEKTLAEKLQPLIAAGRFNPPWVRDLAGTLREPEESVRQVLRKQVTRGAVYQVVHDLFYDYKCIDELAGVITDLAQEHGGTVEAAHYRDAVGLGRKRAIQILEFFDRAGHTRWMRESRVVRADSGWRRGT